jgi:type II secretory pathway component PulC
MTRHVAYQLMLLGAGALAIPVGISGLRPVRVVLDETVSAKPTNAESIVQPPLDSLVRLIVNHDAFRVTRAPAPIAFNSLPPEATPIEVPPPKPQLLLTGIVWGKDPAAIVEGIPGTEGSRLLRTGETIGGLHVRRITEHNVTIAGMDTTWVLEVRKPW